MMLEIWLERKNSVASVHPQQGSVQYRRRRGTLVDRRRTGGDVEGQLEAEDGVPREARHARRASRTSGFTIWQSNVQRGRTHLTRKYSTNTFWILYVPAALVT